MTEKNRSPVRFEAQVYELGPWAILRLPEVASAKLPSRGQVAVKVVVNRHHFQAVLEPDGERGHWLKVDNTLREAMGVSPGGTVTLEIDPTKTGQSPRYHWILRLPWRTRPIYMNGGRILRRWHAGSGCAG